MWAICLCWCFAYASCEQCQKRNKAVVTILSTILHPVKHVSSILIFFFGFFFFGEKSFLNQPAIDSNRIVAAVCGIKARQTSVTHC